MPKIVIVMRKSLTAATIATTGLVLAATGLSYSGWHGYLADQCSQLHLVFAAALAFLLIVLLLCRARLGAGLALAGVCFNLLPLVPFYLPYASASTSKPEDGSEDGRNINIVTMNIYGAHNNHYDKVTSFVREKHPEVLCLNEITKSWTQHLNDDLPEYKYHFNEGISGGSAIYSRIPIDEIVSTETPHVRRYGVRGKLSIAGNQVLLFAEHPPAPTARDRWNGRNKELKRLSSELQNSTSPFILIGDLNSTPWSPYFHEFVEQSNLVDSEWGKGIQPSWNALLPVPPMVPIDHCLTSKQFVVIERSLGPNVGSDHLPVCVKLRLEDKSRQRT